MTITYQQAKRIRKTGWLDLMSDQLMYEKKLGTAVKKTVSLKTRGMMMGIGEKFDPLNIARLLTFGSSIGPALLGHLTGRNANDIQYFSKRFKPIHEKRTADRITKLQGTGGGFDAGSTQVLQKIYKLLNNSYQNDIQRLELAKNREEEHDLEEQRRHKELLEALQGRATLIKLPGEKEDTKGGWFNKIKDMLSSSMSAVGFAIKELFEKVFGWVKDSFSVIRSWTKTLVEKLGSGLARLIFGMRSMLIPMIGFLTNPLVLGALGLAAAGYAYNQWGKTTEGLKQQLMRNDAELASLKNQLQYMSPTIGNQPNPEYQKKKNLYDSKLKENESLKTQLKQSKESGPEKVDESLFDKLKNIGKTLFVDDFKLDIPELNLPSQPGLNFNFTAGGNPSLTPVSESNVPKMPAFDSGSVSSWDAPTPVANLSNITPVATPAATVETPSVENADTKLQSKVSVSVPKVENNVTNMKQGSDGVPLRRPIPSVRNNEEWYNRVLEQNTRLPN